MLGMALRAGVAGLAIELSQHFTVGGLLALGFPQELFQFLGTCQGFIEPLAKIPGRLLISGRRANS
jgi:hypothetical protein